MPDMERIKKLNDDFRTTLIGGRIVLTQGVLHHPEPNQILERVKCYREFADNDPYGEHDFGAFEAGNEKLFWKIDYYSSSLDSGSDDPADPAKTTRVLTVMLASDW